MKIRAVIFSLVFAVISCVALSSVFAEAETLTITTYYPSPYGSYNELDTNYLDYGTGLSSPPVLGADCDNEGRTAYNSTINELYLCDGEKWKGIGGGKFGNWATYACDNNIHQASSDGFLNIVLATGGSNIGRTRVWLHLADSTSSPDFTLRRAGVVAQSVEFIGGKEIEIDVATFLMPIKNGQYWKLDKDESVTPASEDYCSIFWLPLQ